MTDLMQPLATMVDCLRCGGRLLLTDAQFTMGRPGGWRHRICPLAGGHDG